MIESYDFQKRKGQEAAAIRAQIAKENLEKEKAAKPMEEADRKLRFVAEEKEREQALKALEEYIAKNFGDKKKEEMN